MIKLGVFFGGRSGEHEVSLMSASSVLRAIDQTKFQIVMIGITKEGKWLQENCWDYGFIIRYQEDKEEITKIIYEPWHLRYVGVQVAQYMHENNLSLEEFTQE